MPILFLYVLKLSCSLAVIWLFYRLLLRNLTFYALSRWYLLGYSLLAFLVPLIDVSPALENRRPDGLPVLQFIPALGEYTSSLAHAPSSRTANWSAWTIASAILLLGILFLLIRTVARWLSLRQLRRSATLIRGGNWKIYQVDQEIRPFSFGKAIYINRGLHSEQEWEEIILHEYEHVRGRHTVDIILAEWLTILNWYNPFAWLIRHSIRQNLEFIADRKVLAGGFDRKNYQYHLLKVVGEPQYRLANNFNFSSLKKRIIMMNKLRSTRLHLVKFLFVLPLMAVLLVAFRDSYSGSLHRRGGPVYINAVGIVIGLPDKEPLAGVTVKEKSTGLYATTDARGFYQLRIPVTHDPFRVHLDFAKSGYESSSQENLVPSLQESAGMIANNALVSETKPLHGAFMVIPYIHKPPMDPTYEDALASMEELLKENEDVQRVMALQKANPEVALFYTIEHRPIELVIHRDGSVEKFGVAGGPTIDDLEKKYGPVPGWLKQHDPGAGSGYLAKWAAISAQAEKEFHPTNPTARAIIFPGDSRVIVVDASGKARIYDMDSGAPEERHAFEQEFGKLPECVQAGTNSPYRPRPDTFPIPRRNPRVDTVPASRRDTAKWSFAGMDSLGHTQWEFGNSLRKPVTDTVPDFGNDTLRADFSQRSRRDEEARFSYRPHPPFLFIVDGIEKDSAALRKLNPGEIASIEVLKDSANIARYGPRGKNGVVLVHLKSPAPAKP
jgi:beta-lactamase regulating signal transducer with metallopeptidase domain